MLVSDAVDVFPLRVELLLNLYNLLILMPHSTALSRVLLQQSVPYASNLDSGQNPRHLRLIDLVLISSDFIKFISESQIDLMLASEFSFHSFKRFVDRVVLLSKLVSVSLSFSKFGL